MKRIKGEINTFAIECDVTKTNPYLMGHLCLWIGGIKLGAYEDEVMLSSVKAALDRIIVGLDQRQNLNFTKIDKDDLFALVYDEDFNNSQYLLHFGESFDDFSLFSFTTSDEIHFIWKLHDNPFFSYPHYPKEILHKKVKIEEFVKTVQDKELWQP